jgi:hypothetical protein
MNSIDSRRKEICLKVMDEREKGSKNMFARAKFKKIKERLIKELEEINEELVNSGEYFKTDNPFI